MRAAFLDRHAALLGTAIVEIVEIDHLADFNKAEPDILCTHDPCEPRAVPLGIDARQAHPRWRDQALVLVESQRACGAVELGGQEIGRASCRERVCQYV